MAVNLVTVTGNLETLSGATPSLGRVWFKLNRPDWNLSGDIFAPEYIEVIASAGGAFSVTLQSTDDLEAGASYSVILKYREPLDNRDREYTVGQFMLPTGGPYQLGDLLTVPFVEPVPADILALCQAYAVSAAADAAAAALAASTTTPTFADRAEAIAATVGATVDVISVLAGNDLLFYRRDAAGTALTTNSGAVSWSPAGPVVYGQHFGMVSDGVDSLEGWKVNRRVWVTATAYAVNDILWVSGLGYRCIVAHTSSGDFATDLAAGKWVVGAFTGTDNTVAMQAALDYCGLTKKALHIPSGSYRFAPITVADTGRLMLNYKSHTITGDGFSATKLFVDDDLVLRGYMDFIRTPGIVGTTGTSTSRTLRDSLIIKDIGIYGRWEHSPEDISGTNIMAVQNFKSITFDAVGVFNVRAKLSRNKHADSARVINSTFERIASDCLRFGDTNHISIVGNTFKWVDDDVIALHAPPTVTTAQMTSCTISGNTFEQCESVLILGAKHVTVTGNTFKFSKSSAVYIGGMVEDEGSTQTQSIVVVGNTVIDPIMRYFAPDIATQADGNGAIVVSGIALSSLTTSGAHPGSPNAAGTNFIEPRGADSGSPVGFLMYNYDPLTTSQPHGHNYIISNNSIMRTLPPVASFSFWGFGFMYSAEGGWVDPSVAITQFQKHGIVINSDSRNIAVTGNTVMGFPNGAGVYLQVIAASLDHEKAFDNIVISSNSVLDCKYGVAHNKVASVINTPLTWGVSVRGNTFDCDPYHTSTARTAPLNGTWQAGISVTARPVGVFNRNSNGWVVDGNTFKNSYDAVLGTAEGVINTNNTLLCDPLVVGFSDTNRGIGDVGTGARYRHVVIGCDPRPVSVKTITVTRSGLVVTATATAHGYAVGQPIIVSGAAEAGYNGLWFITGVTADTFTYNIISTPTTPGTGTISATTIIYDKHIFAPNDQATSVPINGKYVTGYFVKNSAPTTSASKTTLGWVRQTVGVTHSVATTDTADWAAIVATTS